MPAIFITGTRQGVGKTAIAAALVQIFRRQDLDVGVMKPVASGCQRLGEGWVNPHIDFLSLAMGRRDPEQLMCVYPFEGQPLEEPWEQCHRPGISMPQIVSNYFVLLGAHDLLLVEDDLCPLSPLAPSQSSADLVKWLRIPVVVVSSCNSNEIGRLRQISETLQSNGANILGVIVNNARPGERQGADCPVVEQLPNTGLRLLGEVPFFEGLKVEDGRMGNFAGSVRERVNLEPLWRCIEQAKF